MKKFILIFKILFILYCLPLYAQPIVEWTQRYNSSGNYYDYVNDMVVDAQGNMYIAGHSNADFLTMKYNASGNLQWAKTFDSPYHAGDQAIAVGLDKNKYVYVTGKGTNIYGKEDFMTIKYSNDGNLLWMREYINPDSAGAYSSALAVDDSGNVFVTGYCYKPDYTSKFGTVKYNTNGIFQWARFYGGVTIFSDMPYSITVDKKGNSYITGNTNESGNLRPITTIKYDSSGDIKWVNKYYGPNNTGGRGLKIRLDIFGNIFVGAEGTSGTNTKYDFILIKYDTSGTEKWVRRYHCQTGSNGNAYLKDISVDNNNNIYVAGNNDSNQNGWDFTTLKYNNNGDWQWIRRYKKAFNSSDDVNAITADRFNNIYVTGRTDNNTPWYQYLTVKYSTDGNFNWAMTYNNNSSYTLNHEGIAIGADSIGSIYITGNSEGNGTSMDIATIKYVTPTTIKNINSEVPNETKLFQNYPNPFNPVTNIKYQISKIEKGKLKTENSFVSIKIFDLLGREISSLVNEKQKVGVYEVLFDGSNLSTGIYFYRIQSGDFIQVKRMVLIK